MAKNKKIKNIPQTSGKKPVYETPSIVILGELARGSGVCGQGSNPVGSSDSCSIGILAASDCSHGASV